MRIIEIRGKISPPFFDRAPTRLECRRRLWDIDCVIEGYFSQSLVKLVITTSEDVSDPITFINEARDIAQSVVDAASFIQTQGFILILEDVFFPEKKEFFALSMHASIEPSEKIKTYDAREIATYAVNDQHLGRCLSELRASIRNTVDTGFHCYRAIEALMQYFRNDGSKEAGWERLRDALSVSHDDIKNVKSFADVQRHGQTRPITWEQRKEIMEFTWNLTSKYIEHRKFEAASEEAGKDGKHA